MFWKANLRIILTSAKKYCQIIPFYIIVVLLYLTVLPSRTLRQPSSTLYQSSSTLHQPSSTLQTYSLTLAARRSTLCLSHCSILPQKRVCMQNWSVFRVIVEWLLFSPDCANCANCAKHVRKLPYC